MIYIDANIFVSAITGDHQTKSLITQVITGKLKASTSLLSWDEFIWALRKYLNKDQIILESKNFLLFPNLIFLDISPNIIGRAHELMETYGIHPRDAIHAASALCNGITEISSEDTHFDKIKELKRISLKDLKLN
ncbi:MAG TPA: type II toxin-antitoxin system VapC family toxin [Candidatus Nanoarchaeia archaeon]|nr:type II toxin-antitoxin system VapC family toxin [Candidatus Nanoarchaeia archaeon]